METIGESSVFRRVSRAIVAAAMAALLTATFGATALAWSGRTCAPGGPGCPPSRRLPYTNDYLDTRTYMATGLPFDATSSSWFWGTNPSNAYLFQDQHQVTVHGPGASISNTGGGVGLSDTTVESTCTIYYWWYCGTNMYNLDDSVSIFYWDWTSVDHTTAVVWAGTTPYNNFAYATKWW